MLIISIDTIVEKWLTAGCECFVTSIAGTDNVTESVAADSHTAAQ